MAIQPATVDDGEAVEVGDVVAVGAVGGQWIQVVVKGRECESEDGRVVLRGSGGIGVL